MVRWSALAWFFRLRLIFCHPLRRLLACLHIVLVDPSLIASYDSFHECGVGIAVIQHVRRDLLAIMLLQKIQLFRYKSRGHLSHAHNFNQNRTC
uniref:Putative secreted protein n=1 Tax=Anopheles darlingi TaxID=43151 RepID=A0A2M4DL77_ANODA